MGNLDVDLFQSGDRLVVLELNQRFGGGYPFSHEMGARYPDALIAWADKRQFDASSQVSRVGALVTKCDRLIAMQHK